MADVARRNALVQAARRGDTTAFESLFAEMHPRVYNFIAHLVGDEADAEDLTQAAFIRAWEALPRLRSPEAFVVWLHRIARNMARDQLRAREKAAADADRVDDESGARALEDTARNRQPERALLDAERHASVRSAVSALPEHHREVVVLHHLNGMPVHEVAETLGVAVGTVLSRLARARETLRRRLHWLVVE